MARLFVKRLNEAILDANRPPDDPAGADVFMEYDDGRLRRVRFNGFSYFGEIGGAFRKDGIQIHLDADLTGGDAYQILDGDRTSDILFRYRQWCRLLQDHRINLVRVFLFVEGMPGDFPRYQPFLRKANGKYDLTRLDDSSPAGDVDYVTRLTRFIQVAAEYDIVVCVSLGAKRSLQGGPAQWDANPFNHALNVNDVVEHDDGTPVTDKGVDTYCQISNDPAAPANRRKLYDVQKTVVQNVVELTRPHWNVIYEIFNEPFANMTNVVEWHGIVAGWIDEKIWDPVKFQRSHIIAVNAPDSATFGHLMEPILARLLVGAADQPLPLGRSLVDLFQFHGGAWADKCDLNDCYSTVADVRDAARARIQEFYARVLDGRVSAAYLPLAVWADGDACYCSQAAPHIYAPAAFDLNLSFNYRWSDDYLTHDDLGRIVAALRDALPRPDRPGDLVARVAGTVAEVEWTPAWQARAYRLRFYTRAPSTGLVPAPFPPPVDVTGTFPLPTDPPAPPAVVTRQLAYDRPWHAHAVVVASDGASESPPSNPFEISVGALFAADVHPDTNLPEYPDSAPLPDRRYRGVVKLVNRGWTTWGRWGITPEDPLNTERRVYPSVLLRLRADPLLLDTAETIYVRLDPADVERGVRYGEVGTFTVDVILPYSRVPIEIVSVEVSALAKPLSSGYVVLPITPRHIAVAEPKRRALRIVDEIVTLAPGATASFPLDSVYRGPTYELVALSSSSASAAPGTVIRAEIVVSADRGSQPRVLNVTADAAGGALAVRVQVARVDIYDLTYGDWFQVGSLAVPAGQEREVPLAPGLHSGHPALSWAALPEGGPVVTRADIRASQAGRVFAARNDGPGTARIAYDIAGLAEFADPDAPDPRERRFTLTVSPEAPTARADLGPAVPDRWESAAVLAPAGGLSAGTIGWSIVLRAGGDGALRRVVDVAAADLRAAQTVELRVLDVPLTVEPWTPRAAADLPADLAASILDAFNGAETAEALTHAVADNPAFGHSSMRAYGLRPSLARRILATRAALPGGRFTSVEEIDRIAGVGRDTFQDIVYANRANGGP